MEWTDQLRKQAHKHVSAHVAEHNAVLETLASTYGATIGQAAERLVQALLRGNKILACGNGGSAAEASHFAAEMVGRLERERPGLAALSLTADAAVLSALGNDYGYEAVFAQQVSALGVPGDVLLAISTSGTSANVVRAVESAIERDLVVVALLGEGGGEVARRLREGVDAAICVPSLRTMRVQEMHKLIVHILCQWIDDRLLGGSDEE
jgi:D-sedoheptulose 7-phosphate isomerase